MPLPTVLVADIAKFSPEGIEGFNPDYLQAVTTSAVDWLQAQWGSLIQKRLDSGVLTLHLYQQVIANAVFRIANNPRGLTMEQAGSYQYQVRAAVASGYLMFTTDELNTLLGLSRSMRLPGTVGIGLYGQP